jgi:hypothetical protein
MLSSAASSGTLQATFFLEPERQNFTPKQNKRQNNGFCVLILRLWTPGWKTSDSGKNGIQDLLDLI